MSLGDHHITQILSTRLDKYRTQQQTILRISLDGGFLLFAHPQWPIHTIQRLNDMPGGGVFYGGFWG